MNTKQQIVPIDEIKSYDSFQIFSIMINPYNSEKYANGIISLYSSADDSMFKQMPVEFTKEELDPWGADDSIIYTIVANKLGFTLA